MSSHIQPTQYTSLQEGYIESKKSIHPQFIHRDKCGCTFMYCLNHNGIWKSEDSTHRDECLWKHVK